MHSPPAHRQSVLASPWRGRDLRFMRKHAKITIADLRRELHWAQHRLIYVETEEIQATDLEISAYIDAVEAIVTRRKRTATQKGE